MVDEKIILIITIYENKNGLCKNNFNNHYLRKYGLCKNNYILCLFV